MKTLRGRPPRNISEAGLIYLDSESEDSDYSDSDVEPVFFPAAEFDIEGDPFLDLVEDLTNGDDSDSDHAAAEDIAFFNMVNNEADETSQDTVELDNDSAESDSVENVNQAERAALQYFGGTVEVRHIVHDNFVQLHLHQQRRGNGEVDGEVVELAPSSSAAETRDLGEIEQVVENLVKTVDTNTDSEESQGEPPSILETGITIGVPQEVKETEKVAENSKMNDQHSEDHGTPSSPPAIVQIVAQENDNDKSADESDLKESALSHPNNPCGPSGLVPYPDLPDYASGGEEGDDDLWQQKESTKRLSLKRKEPEESSDEENGGERNKKPESSKSAKALRNLDDREDELSNNDEEETCNPMVSDTEEYDESEDAFRGDRIGNTVYSERHVLKILMQWIENLPQYSIDKLLCAKENEEPEEVIEKTILRLETGFEEQMSLLWDMSAETDVMSFLVENKIFSFIRDTVDRSACGRLTEIALGILANVISEPSVIDDFTVHDASLDLVERVVELSTKVSDVAVLIQVFCVLRRIVWYIRNVAHVKKWIDLLTCSNFLERANFIMRSSTNALLLGNVIVLFFALIDCLNTEHDAEEDDSESARDGGRSNQDHGPDSHSDTHEESASTSKKNVDKEERMQVLVKNYEPFCDGDFVPSLCEGLKELMKDPKPKNTRKNLTSTREKPAGPSDGCQTDEHCPTADEIDVPIPEGHVQQAILKGFSTLALLQKAPNGKDALKRHASVVINSLLGFYRIFIICTDAITRSDSLEYFALSLHILSYTHVCLDSMNVDAIVSPVTTASKLVNQEEKDKELDMPIRVQLKDGVEFDSVSYIALVTHEYLAAVAEKFGPDSALKVRNNTAYDKFFRVLDQVVSKFTEEDNRSNNDGSLITTTSKDKPSSE